MVLSFELEEVPELVHLPMVMSLTLVQGEPFGLYRVPERDRISSELVSLDYLHRVFADSLSERQFTSFNQRRFGSSAHLVAIKSVRLRADTRTGKASGDARPARIIS